MAPKKPPTKPEPKTEALDPMSLPTPSISSTPLRMSYRIARGEQGVLTFEPYKSYLLPHWRFRTLPIARASSAALKTAFSYYVDAGDFVGADMTRKFIQMGMTRAKRYANHKGGRKYERIKGVRGEEGRVGWGVKSEDGKGGKGTVLAKSEGHEGQEEKLKVSEHFKGVWRKCIEDEAYLELKKRFQEEQKVWDRERKKVKKEGEDGVEVKDEVKVKEESDEG